MDMRREINRDDSPRLGRGLKRQHLRIPDVTAPIDYKHMVCSLWRVSWRGFEKHT